jgi:excinuclease ABC subunit A
MPRSTIKTTKKSEITEKSHENVIFIKGARVNNLKNLDLKIPKNKLVVVTGVSGSGKSSVIIDTLFAEGQRRYVESLSAYARQFLNRMKKPDIDFIHGLCPAIAIEQKVVGTNTRSTVGSLTEIYDFIRLLFSRVGHTYSPISGQEVKKHAVSDVVDFIFSHKEGDKGYIMVPIQKKYVDRTLADELNLLQQRGFARLFFENEAIRIDDFETKHTKLTKLKLPKIPELYILVDRFSVTMSDEENEKRIADSVGTAFQESGGECLVKMLEGSLVVFNNKFEMDGLEFPDPVPNLFNYNNPIGACPRCEGFGKTIGVDKDKVIPDKTLSVYDGAILAWKGEKSSEWLKPLLKFSAKFNFPVHAKIKDLTPAQQKLLWTGNEYFQGLNAFFGELEEAIYKIQNRVMLARFRGKTDCPDCDGGRLRKEAFYVKVQGYTFKDFMYTPVEELSAIFNGFKLPESEAKIAQRLLNEVTTRIGFLEDLGLGYLNLDRAANTLSGGETQRINLTRTLGSNLTSSMYLLDEPSIGLHPKDTAKMITVLERLRDLGNTVVVIEHEEEIMMKADQLIDIGPEAGVHGGTLVFQGKLSDAKGNESLTAQYLSGKKSIPVPVFRREGKHWVEIVDANLHNLQNLSCKFPLQAMTVITGVSGSGKTTLVKGILMPALESMLMYGGNWSTSLGSVEGDVKKIHQVEMVSQNPIGKSSRSNPVTYVKAYDDIRDLFAKQPLSKIRGYQPRHFSFNVDGGRCDSCKGEGEQIIEMQFLADVRLECEECQGQKFKKEILEIEYRGKNIHDILLMPVEEALEFFRGDQSRDAKAVYQKIRPLADVGLGYVQLGQSSSTLSGGEAQRVKLASFLNHESYNLKILFIFDEPTTGLHFHDISKLLIAMNGLIERGHTILVVEHNVELIKCADWVIDLGPGAGKHGGQLVAQGTPEEIIKNKKSEIGKFLSIKLKK